MIDNFKLENNSESAKDLLLADYKYLSECFWRTEEIGETRVKFFITLVTAVLAALATLTGIENNVVSEDSKFVIGIYTLSALLTLGIITLFRIIKRNRASDSYKRDMDEIRQRFKDYFDETSILSGYKPFGKTSTNLRSSTKSVYRRKIGGLSYTVAAMNSLIFSAMAGLVFFRFSKEIIIIAAGTVIIFALSLYFQFKKIKDSDERSQRELDKSDFTHGGGIVVRFESSEPSYLVITAKNNPKHWIFPKGHIEEDETVEQTAEREVAEETGFESRILDPIGLTCFSFNNESIRIKFYLMEFLFDSGNKENRQMRWCTYEEALNLLTFADTRKLLRLAHSKAQKFSKSNT